MRRPNRSISILSMSALDVLAMATGVFVLLLVMLMPYYRKTMDAEAEIEARGSPPPRRSPRCNRSKTTAARRSPPGAAAAEAAELQAARGAGAGGPASSRPSPVVQEGPIRSGR